MSKTGGYDLSMLGSAGQMAAQQFASKVQDARWLMYGARMLLHPFQTIMFAIMLIILSIYITSNTSYKKSFGFLSFLLIAGTIGFTVLKFVPNPAWVVTKPAMIAMGIVEEVEEATGLSADDILMQIASGATQIGSAAATAQSVDYTERAPPEPIAPAPPPTAPVPAPAINPQIEQQKREQEKLDDEARERYAGQQRIQEDEIREQRQQALLLGPPPPRLTSDGFGYPGPPPQVNAATYGYYERAPPTNY
jgi:hypothetical protein